MKKSKLPTGIHLNQNGKYQAAIRIEKRKVYLGSFATPELASKAYQFKLKEIT